MNLGLPDPTAILVSSVAVKEREVKVFKSRTEAYSDSETGILPLVRRKLLSINGRKHMKVYLYSIRTESSIEKSNMHVCAHTYTHTHSLILWQ